MVARRKNVNECKLLNTVGTRIYGYDRPTIPLIVRGAHCAHLITERLSTTE